ncbi:hypothetical protein [Paraburkholderia sp. J8-2]|uniref:hypothetical protein n=1 Tax=Paraburkholderia sp. J8-2 TaxID=2805440 RepID=UPI002AB72AFC|nr:hypothetical protein [Paraburkholderia sp. J8-2]
MNSTSEPTSASTITPAGRVIKHGRTEHTIQGPYFVVVMKGDRVGSSVTGIQTPERCQQLAEEYAQRYGAPIVTPRLGMSTPSPAEA